MKKGQPSTRSFNAYMQKHMANPEFANMVAEEEEKLDIWLQLQRARLETGLTQEEVAIRMGKKQAQVSKLESPSRKNNYNLASIQEFLEALQNDYEIDITIRKRSNKQPV